MTFPAPVLIVIAGPARGRTITLDRAITVGRDESSELAIPDLALSRRHCEITFQDGHVVLRDLQSLNGSFVNDRPVTLHTLSDGDRIRIGDSALLLVQTASQQLTEAESEHFVVDDAPSTVALQPRESRYLGPPSGTNDFAVPRATRDLTMLLRLSRAAQAATSATSLGEMLLGEAIAAVGADGGALLATSDAGDVTLEHVAGQADHRLVVSRTVAMRAMREQIALLANDLAADPRFREAASVRASPVRAALAVPLLTTGGRARLLYLVRSGGCGFADEDLHLVAALGVIGGLAIDRLHAFEDLENENLALRRPGALEHDLIGESTRLNAVLSFIRRVAPTDSTVFVRGESGTGKELVAAAIHANSPRARAPFVAINCAALPEHLLESELFGHERGAFTGAVAQQRGRLELADRGTLFLDEIGELAPALQAKLLRVLQNRIVERLGGRRGIPIDVRVIAATNRDVESDVASGAFRQDLYFRINVVSIELPPLRERDDDVLLLAAHFLRKHSARCKRRVRTISPAARKLLKAYAWPGNVRELDNAIERAVVLGTTESIEPEDLPEALLDCLSPPPDDAGFHARVTAHKRTLIRETLERTGGNVALAARALALQPTYLHRLIRNLGLRGDSQE